MHLLWILLIGLVVGWLAGVLMRGRGYGVLADIVIGIVGSWIGSWIGGLLGIQATTGIGSFLMALVGALALIAIVKAIHKSA